MRFHRLQIPAFGPFTHLDLEFSQEPADLHVIYGPNEAGKSSLLRAIHDLLFGIPAQSGDDFVHKYTELKIRAEIGNRAGERLFFQRRKGNKNTLQDGAGNVLPESALGYFLGRVDEHYFSAMFGLGVRELQEGARELLGGEGELGQALFSASLGGTPVQKVLAALRAESERIYKGRSITNVSLRPAVTRYRDLVRQSRDAMVNADEWTTLEKELTQVEAQKRCLEGEIAGACKDLAAIERCEGGLPIVGRLTEALQGLDQLPTLPQLASDFPARARAAREAVRREEGEGQRLADRISKLQAQRALLSESPDLLGCAESLERLHQDLGAYRTAKAALAELKTRLGGLEMILRAGMDKLELTGHFDSLLACRLSSPARLAFEAAANDLRQALTEEANCVRKIGELKDQIHDGETELAGLTEQNLAQLRDALTAAESAIEADRTIGESQAESQRLGREIASQQHQVSSVLEDPDRTANLCVPALATVRLYQERFDELKREIKAEEKVLQESKRRFETTQAELARISRQGELPTEESLRQAREHRDRGWKLVLEDWQGAGTREELEPGVPLQEAFPEAMQRADAISDALRHEAEAVAQAEQKRLQLVDADKQVARALDKTTQLQAALDDCRRAWEGEWSGCGIIPRSPHEMIEWRENWTAFKDRFNRLRTVQEVLATKQNQILEARARLAAALGDTAEKEFSLLFQKAKTHVQEAEEQRGRRSEITRQLKRSRAELAKFEQSRSVVLESVRAAASRWTSQCEVLGFAKGTTPEAGLTLLRERNELVAQFDQWKEMSRNRELTQERVESYEHAVEQCAASLAIPAESTERLESALWKGLAEARKIQSSRASLAEQIELLELERIDAQSRLGQAKQVLAELAASARLTNLDDLEGFLALLEQRASLQSQISQLRGNLVGLAGAAGVDTFVAQVRAQNPDELRLAKNKAEQTQRESESALANIRQTLFGLMARKSELEKAGDGAAHLCQQLESCATGLRHDATRFLRLRLATHLLELQVERFRKENQGPLLERTGELFCAITRGAFSGLAAEVNADDLPVLVGLRPSGAKVFVEGLSQGTKDQLYLALRLAALGRHLQDHEPMPLILDDLMITFDDERTRAILPELARLGQSTQVFLFTHHQHLVELCRATLGAGQFQLHPLAQASK